MYLVTGVTFARWTGALVDKFDNLGIVRAFIIVQKLSTIIAYVTSAAILSPERFQSQNSWYSILTPHFALLVVSSCILHLSNIGVSIAVEREWATCIAQGPNFSERLSRLNTYLRQVNLLCKLCAPLFVSILTVKIDTTKNTRSIWILSTISAFTLFFELYWIGVVYSRFPALRDAQRTKNLTRQQALQDQAATTSSSSPTPQSISLTIQTVPFSAIRMVQRYLSGVFNSRDWSEYVHLPIFFSSISISLLYLTVLS
jgi:solute carrier family 40 (iron-regulated transporter), member 1